jgi:predicted DNA-binding helix-hairpin-helix protein
LRNLAGVEKEAKEFVASGALAELVAALTYHTDRDVLTNVARCLRYFKLKTVY